MAKDQLGKYRIVQGRLQNVETGILIPLNEPLFLLRAKDIVSVDVLVFYLANHEGQSIVPAVQSRLDAFVVWRRENPEKIKMAD